MRFLKTRFVRFGLLTLVCSISLTSIAAVKPQQDKDKKVRFAPNRVIVKFKSRVPPSLKRLSHVAVGSQLVKEFRNFHEIQTLSLPKTMSVDKALAVYAQDPNVEFAEPDYVYNTSLAPDDNRFNELWALNNTGQTGGAVDADINAPEAWDITTGGSKVIVAVIDTGVDYNHPDLVDNMWINPGEIAGNNFDDDGNGYIDDVHGINAIDGSGNPMDDFGHGTHVAGTIAARGNNANGVVGVNWNAQIIACKFIGLSGGYASDAIECLDYLLDLKTRATHPVDIIVSNNSWGGGGYSQALFKAIEAARNAGMLFVAAAGNYSLDNDLGDFYPADFELSNIISVAATDHTDALAYFSNFGRHSIDIGAPGVAILSTVPTGSCFLCDPTGYLAINGTSMAAPHVSGLAALLKADDPARDWTEIKNLLVSSGEGIASLTAKTISGKRLRAADENGVGALTCDGQVMNQRLQPIQDSLSVIINNPVTLMVEHINCANANGDVSVAINDDMTVVLTDDGLGTDEYAGDGLYSASFIPDAKGTTILTFPGGDVVTLEVSSTASNNYQAPITTNYNYRTITGTALFMSDDSIATITSPFPVQYGGILPGFTTLHISSNGYISFGTPVFLVTSIPLPIMSADKLVAPLFGDLNPANGDDVYWAVQGTAPNRELIIEWRNIPYFPSSAPATFQVVFFESSPDVLFNYAAVNFGNSNYDYGASATVGLQVSSNLARQYSYNEASLTDAMSLLWVNGISGAYAGPDQTVNPGSPVGLNGSGSSGTIVSYNWSQTAGTTVVLNEATTVTPYFTAPADAGTLSFELTTTNDTDEITLDMMNVIVNAAPIANAGPDRASLADQRVVLDGTRSVDSDGRISKINWIQTAGVDVVLSDAKSTTPGFISPPTSDILTFALTVMDNGGLTQTDTVNVVVDGPPTANAGPDQTVRQITSVTLDAGASSDRVGTISSYNWVQTTGTTVNITGANTVAPGFTTPSLSETLSFELTVIDSAGFSATDTVNIIVDNPPLADAGADQIVQTGKLVTLDAGESKDKEGDISAYQWVQTGGATVSLSNPAAVSPSFTAPSVASELSFELTVTDYSGFSSTDSVNVTVDPPPDNGRGGCSISKRPVEADPLLPGLMFISILGLLNRRKQNGVQFENNGQNRQTE